jgi:protein-S-isoprenylcysteine O-methyltransferase Ste14
MSAMDFFARWRVRLGYLLAIIVLVLARPVPWFILLGGAIGLVGLVIRARAAGYLHKQEVLTMTGPYAHTRNPLYFGSGILGLGAAVAMHSWWAAMLLLVYFALVYSFVMRREEQELRAKYGTAFDAYAGEVPLFFPCFPARRLPGTGAGSFSWAQFRKNHEYEAAIGFFLFLVVLAVIWRLRAP